MNFIIDQHIHDELTALAEASPRLWMNMDLRNSSADGAKRMLNAIEPGTLMPYHRHWPSDETVVCIRGYMREIFCNGAGKARASI